jgi:large subunit ribosomal protein L10
MPAPAKIEALENLKTRLDGVKTAVLTEYRGLTVRQMAELRRQLKVVSATCTVVKNRIVRLAVTESPLRELTPHLKGPTAIVLSQQDPVAVAKALHLFARGNQQLLIKAGYAEGQVLAAPEIRSLAELPSREVLRSQLVASVQGPLAQLVGLLDAPLREIAYILDRRGAGAEAGAEPGARE